MGIEDQPVVSWFQTYTKWLHGRWPAGVVEKLPQVDEQYGSNIPASTSSAT